MKVKYITILFVPVLLSLCLTGCWDSRSIDQFAVVIATALDYSEDGRIMASSQIAVPSSVQTASQGINQSGAGSQGFTVVTALGNNVHEAIDELQRKISRKLFIDHRKVLIIGEELARRGIKDTLDHYSRDPDSRLQTFFLIARNAKGVDLLMESVPFEKVPGRSIRRLQEINGENAITLRELFSILAEGETVPTVGALELLPASEGGSRASGGTAANQLAFRLGGSAVIKDYKLDGYLNMEQTRGLLWVQNKYKQNSITGYIPPHGNIALELDKTHSDIKTRITDGKVYVDVSIEAEGAIHENNTDLDLSDPSQIGQVEEALSQTIADNIRKAVAISQKKLKADIFGIGQEIYRKHPKQWSKLKDRWADAYPEVEFSVKSSVRVTRTGMYGLPLHLKENK